MATSLIIIGSGVAGLSAGCYAQMNGYDTTILEMANTPGGLCISWKRDGYLFDGSIAGLAGSNPGSPLFQLWEELGVIKYCPLHYGDNFGSIYLPDGKIITVYTDIEKLEIHLLENFPNDSKSILEFTGGLRSVLKVDAPFSASQGWKALMQQIKALPSVIASAPALVKYGKMTIDQFAEKFKDPTLSLAFRNFVHFGGPDVPMLTLLLPIAYAHRKMAGIPLKGWLDFARSIEKRFLDLGGKIHYRSRVSKLLLEKGVAKGVILGDDITYYADRILSAADGRFSQSLLLGKAESETRDPFRIEELSDQPVQVNIGVNQDFSVYRGATTYILPYNFSAAGREQHKITLHNKYYDPDAAPAGKSALTIFLDSDYLWWQEISADRVRYTQEKDICAQKVIEVINTYQPGFKDKVEVVDVSTPLTRERYTGNWMGAMQGRKPGKNLIKAIMQGKPQYQFKGIDGYYMAGQWVEAWGGITTAAQSGRKAIQLMCKHDDKKFITNTA